jgi:prepilin peptidase CpaA
VNLGMIGALAHNFFWGDMVQQLSFSLFPVLMIVAGIGDALSLRIPNWLNQIVFVAFFPLAWATGMPLEVFAFHFLTSVVLLIIGFLLFSASIFGGGDAKLLAAAGIWFGPWQVGPFLAQTAIAGGVLALVVVIWAKISMNWVVHKGPVPNSLANSRPRIPYGYAFAIGAILAFPNTWWMAGPI